MPFKYELTWIKHANRWRKRYKGQTFYLLTDCNGKRDRDGYRDALREWQRLKRHLDGLGPNPYLGKGRDRVLIPEDQQPTFLPLVACQPESAPAIRANGSNGHRAANPITAPSWMSMIGIEGFLNPELVADNPAPNPNEGENRISKLVERYLEKRERRATDGRLSLKQFGEDKRQIQVFQKWLRVNYPTVAFIEDVTAPILNHFRDHQETVCNSETTLRKRLQTVRKWFLWLLDESVLTAPPRDLTTYGRIEVTREQPKFLTVDEIKADYEQANPLLRCCIALSLNAGFTQQDCSTLEQRHIDFDSGILARLRQKTGVEQRAKLWPVTIRLLRECGYFDSDGPLLRTPAGQALVTVRMNEKGKVSKTDHVAYLFRKASKDAKFAGRTFKHLRKTAGNEVEKRNSTLTSLFLSHAERETKRFYVSRHFDDLFAITDELNSHFGLDTIE